ncbi:hypothetical protein MRB53_013158 [Persea americana]|uniref:Uncharacterized protein n=1 Tax=Persea americana TaxID=3435 RepID=A0ACC2K7J6_PERAE|nr:hypothetical protein MRB53_013158 [Persea americana]
MCDGVVVMWSWFVFDGIEMKMIEGLLGREPRFTKDPVLTSPDRTSTSHLRHRWVVAGDYGFSDHESLCKPMLNPIIALEGSDQGSDVPNEARSPLTNKLSPNTDLQPTMLHNSKNYLSPKAMPPLKFYSGFLGPHSGVGVGSEDDDESGASVPDDIDASYSGEEGSKSSDSEMFHKPITQNCDEEVFGAKSSINYGYRHVSSVIRDDSKENLRIEVPVYVRRHTGGHLDSRGVTTQIPGPVGPWIVII